jgi:hypothetical protein
MTPSSFSFKLTVPSDPEGASVVAVVATHAAEYSNMDKAAGDAFVDRVRATAATALKSTPGSTCLVVFAAENGQLTVTFGNHSHSVSQALPA